MKYIVLRDFTDSKYKNHIYSVGDDYPCDGYLPDEARVKALLSSKNRLRYPVIAEAGEVLIDSVFEFDDDLDEELSAGQQVEPAAIEEPHQNPEQEQGPIAEMKQETEVVEPKIDTNLKPEAELQPVTKENEVVPDANPAPKKGRGRARKG